MRLLRALQLAAAVSVASAVELFVTYQASPGAVSTLSLTSVNGSYVFREKSNSTKCGQSPTWLTFDHGADVLYCVDENNSGGPGGLYSFDINDDGSLELIHGEPTGAGPVSSTLYGTKGPEGIVVAEYGKGGFSTFQLDHNTPGQFSARSGTWSNYTNPPLATPGPVAGRQTQSHVHQAILDPTGKFVTFVDLGADKVQTYSYNQSSLEFTGVTELSLPAGTGPRHAAYMRRRNSTDVKMYVVSELSAQVLAYNATYSQNKTALSFQPIGAVNATKTPIKGNAPGEILISPDNKYLYISNRLTSDYMIPNPDPKNSTQVPSDSLSIFSINADGTLTFMDTAPSGGISPRQFSFSSDGEYVAVANYASGNVAILKRNPKTGLIHKLPVAQYGWPGVLVTAAIWNEC